MDKEEEKRGRQCPYGHKLQLRTDHMDYNEWYCDGAVVPYECLSGTTKNKDNKHKPRFQCVENCNFSLCDACFHSEEWVEQPVENVILFMRRDSLRTKQQIPPFSKNAYKRAVYLSGCENIKGQWQWLINEYKHNQTYKFLNELNSPIYVIGDIFKEALLKELIQIGAGFTVNAYKRALFFSGNKTAQDALTWLLENDDDLCLNFPVSEKVQKCPMGHSLVPFDENKTKNNTINNNCTERWICDGDDYFEGCKMTTENYLTAHLKIIKRYTCEKKCNYNICDSCLLAPKASKKHQNKPQQQSEQQSQQQQQKPIQTKMEPIQPQQPLPPPQNQPPPQPLLTTQPTQSLLQQQKQQHVEGYLANLNSPTFVPGDIFNKTLWNELIQFDAGFSENAYKRALFFTSNENAEVALEWLLDEKNSEDSCLNLPISNEVAKCPKGHTLVLSNEKKRWICDKEISSVGCNRKMTTKNYKKKIEDLNDDPRNIMMYVCKETNCRYNLCDSCLLTPKFYHKDQQQEHISRLHSEEEGGVDEKTPPPPPAEYTYQFVNLNKTSKKSFFTNCQHWVDTIKAETKDAKVVSHHLFKSPLTSLPINWGEALVDRKILGKDHHLHHRYLVLVLQKEEGTKTFLSMEKDRTGISVQLHDDINKVKNYHHGEARINPEVIHSKDLMRLNRLEYINLPEIGALLENWEIMSLYKVWDSNCQTMTRYIQDRILDASNAVEFHLPGTNKKASINDSSELLSYIKNRYPKWKKKELVRIPEVQVQYAMKIGQYAFATSNQDEGSARIAEEVSSQEEYQELVLKQNGFEGVCKALNGKTFSNDKKVIFFNLTRDKVEQTLNDETLKNATAESWEEIHKSISDFWRSSFEVVSITSKHGIFIFQYSNTEMSEQASIDDETIFKNKVEILQDLGQFKDKVITTVSIQIEHGEDYPEISDPKVMEYGNHFHLKVSKRNITPDVKYCLKDLAKKVGKLPNDSNLKKLLKNLVPKITILQNIEDETNLVHHKLDYQEWGKPGVMLWSKNQRVCIEMGRNSFKGKNKPLRLIIRGCQGSGKTLVLIRLAREFVLSHKEGYFVIKIVTAYDKLRDELRAVLEQDELMRDRVVVGNFIPQKRNRAGLTLPWSDKEYYPFIDIASVGGICYDEAELMPEGNLRENDLEVMRLMLPKQHMILSTSRDQFTAQKANEACKSVGLNFFFQEINLEGNFRSSPTISNLTTDYQVLSTAGSANIPVKTTMDFSSPRPKIIAQEFPDRDDFLHLVIDEIQISMVNHRNTEIRVLALCHLSLIETMKTMLKNKLRNEGKVIFSHPKDVLGCQFPVVIVIVDTSTIYPYYQHITDALTRATTTLTCIVNTTLKPLELDGQVSFSTATCAASNILAYFGTLAKKFPGTILIEDMWHLLSAEIKEQLDPQRFNFSWKRGNVEEWRLFTKKGSVVVDLVQKPMQGGPSSHQSYCPVIELAVMNGSDCKRNQNYATFRKSIHNFFTQAAKRNK